MTQDVLFKPPGTWTPPNSFPDLSSVNKLGIDIETCDPNLLKKGPGFIRGDAHVVGVSISTEEKSWYFPFRHQGGGNLSQESVVRFLKDQLIGKGKWLLGANLQYELEGLDSLGIDISKEKLIDIQVAEALIDEERESNSLDSLCRTYLGRTKDEKLLIEAAQAYGVDPKGGLWKLPSKYVGQYAEFDALAPIQIFKKQFNILEEDDLLKIFELESKILPLLWLMRKQGFPVDLELADSTSRKLKAREDEHRKKLKEIIGCNLDVWSAKDIASVCDRMGYRYARTEKGNPSFEGDWLDSSSTPLFMEISAIRELERLRDTFIDKWVVGNQIDGRIHCQWKQLVADDGGTRTGRMAASNPNPQQVPARSEFAHLVRALFISDTGLWGKYDYSQQEPRVLTHYSALSKLSGAEAVAMAYRSNKDMDIYQHLAEAANISRRNSKDLTLGRCYGMGKKKLAEKLGVSMQEAERLLKSFDDSVPFVKEIADSCMNKAQARGWIRTLGGRKRHFTFWEPTDAFSMRQNGDYFIPLKLEAAQKKWPGKKLQRAFTHKALNSLIQGSAADMTKMAMLKIHEETGRVPYLQVHDEIDLAVHGEEDAKQFKEICENCVEMCVPIKCDMVVGKHWK